MRADARVYEDDGGEYRWRLRAANGEIVATSEGYSRKADAQRGLQDAQRAFEQVIADPEPEG